jgi:hypothetical protein
METTLQVIMEQLKDMSAVQSELKSDICAEVKSDVNKINADLATQMHAVESKVSECMSVIREELQTQIGDLCAGQAELEERLDKQQKDVHSMVEQNTRDLREGIEATRRDFEARLAAVETRARRAGNSGPGTNTSTVKPPKFDGTTSWDVFHRQFEAAALQNNWQPREKAAHLLSVLQGQAAEIVRTVPEEATYEEISGALKGRFGDHQLAAAFRSQFKARVQTSGETLQEFAAAVEQLAHRALVGLPLAFIQTEASHAFIDGVRDRELKQHLLMGGDRNLNEALNQAMKLEAAKEAAGATAKLRGLTGASPRANYPAERRRDARPVCWQCGSTGHLRRDCRRGSREEGKDQGNE